MCHRAISGERDAWIATPPSRDARRRPRDATRPCGGLLPACQRFLGPRHSIQVGSSTIDLEWRVDEPDGFAEFVRRESRALTRAAWLLEGDRGRAEDLVQTALLKTWRRWMHLGEPETAAAYVRRVMVTTFLSWRRRRWTSEQPVAVLPETVVDDGSDAVVLRRLVLADLDRLPPRQRAVVVLRYLLDLDERATAVAMGCSVGTVKTHHARALAALRKSQALSTAAGQEAT